MSPPPCLPWRRMFPNPWMLRCFTPTPSSIWAMIIWLGLGRIKRRPAKDSPEVKAERRQFLQHNPPVRGKDRTEPNGTPHEAAICLWTPSKKKKTSQDSLSFDSIPNQVKSVIFLPPHPPNWRLQSPIISQMRWAASPWRGRPHCLR